ncbi:MAG: hypothetical protein QF486_00745 [Candidatus Woesearchaeota archaeon]|jgi:hypothetical protein|nr:hypothetical protein [Candidatus Woesearchaeota archaeon]MDP7181252.1 hypothetical protein [Candidatus Woesearchaeota archaeon]MDP7198129.1 hypothetical protein [Candidatus Woesearchaeota archaeon]MDP7466963.1 hypothetical protein [Candidatus Woesearchaeota archaeon]MDP7646951.1 hypothetical protein [Candidatus Woesearchaeota archaeon]|tara:strand:+ start:188 stop:958 length:771 start_codon:yes stop_codon:yes gene_type:complete
MWKEIIEMVAAIQPLPHKTREDLVLIKEKIDVLVDLLTKAEYATAEDFIKTTQAFQAHLELMLQHDKVGMFRSMSIGRMLNQIGRKANDLNIMDRRQFMKTAAAAAMAPYIKFQGKTIGHEILDIEAPIHRGRTPQKAYDNLDSFLERVGKELKRYPEKFHKSPKHMLSCIHRSILMEDFEIIESQEFISVGFATKKRDCDVGSLLFLSAAERYGFPINGVIIPEHMFVCWGKDMKMIWETVNSTGSAQMTKEEML